MMRKTLMRDIIQQSQRMTRSSPWFIALAAMFLTSLIEQFTGLKKLSKCFDKNNKNNEVFFQ
jgi:hypothetical protein